MIHECNALGLAPVAGRLGLKIECSERDPFLNANGEKKVIKEKDGQLVLGPTNSATGIQGRGIPILGVRLGLGSKHSAGTSPRHKSK